MVSFGLFSLWCESGLFELNFFCVRSHFALFSFTLPYSIFYGIQVSKVIMYLITLVFKHIHPKMERKEIKFFPCQLATYNITKGDKKIQKKEVDIVTAQISMGGFW